MNETNKNMLTKILIGLIVLIILLGAGYGTYKIFWNKNTAENKKEDDYTCPMHQQVSSDHPGQCPICGMDLVKRSSLKESDNNNVDGLDLNQVKLSPSQQVLANVQTEKVGRKQFSGEKTFNGYVKINEKNFAHISTRVAGKLQKMYVNFEGQYVKKGQPVFEIYSPELVTSQKELLLAMENYDDIKRSGNQFAIEQALSLVQSSRTRLKLLELSTNQIEELERTKQVKTTLTHYSDYSGTVTKKLVHAGHWASDGEDIYDVADLSNVWVIANVYESDVKYITTGQRVEIISSAYPNEPIIANVNYVSPIFNPESRTLEVRIDVSNRDNRLKPDMFVKVKINTFVDLTLAVPRNAVIRTGEKNIVYIEKEKGVYVPREISISYEQDGYYAVTSGLKEGERIVSSGSFLIDSESEIQKGVMQNMEGMEMKKEDELKINKDQDIMKDMNMKK